MILENTPLIETKRLILRKFKTEDADDLFCILNDEETNRFLPWFPLIRKEEAAIFLKQRFIDHYSLISAYRYAVCLKENDIPIGYVWLSNDESRDFGYGLKKEYWNMGIVTEAAGAVIERIRNAGHSYITATHDINNPASGKVMIKLGMKYMYSYVELWQPKNFLVTFRMYQLNFDPNNNNVYFGYWNKYEDHFI